MEFWDPVIKKHNLDDSAIVTVVNSEMFDRFDFIQEYGHKVNAMETVCLVEGRNDE